MPENLPPPVVYREFEVAVPLELAWQRLAEVERWPEWAPHITKVTLVPAGPLGPSSRGALHLRLFGRNTFRMSVWDPPRRWEWIGELPGVRVHYDHRFEPREEATRLTWIVRLDGPLAPVIRPLFRRIYGRNVDHASAGLQRWIMV